MNEVIIQPKEAEELMIPASVLSFVAVSTTANKLNTCLSY